MVDYDVIIVGGGIAGSIAAKFAAKAGLTTLFIEKDKTPRNKPCSGIQFMYFEDIIGEKIPKSRLCNNQLNKVWMFFPNDFSISSPFPMLNFMRKPFDEWLNQVAQSYGAEFCDECELIDFSPFSDSVESIVKKKNGEQRTLSSRYLIDASGLRPKLRQKLRPQDFLSKSSGATLNFYIDGKANLDPHALYQFWNLDFNDTMFAWIYNKTLDDGNDYWVIGTGCNSGKIIEKQTKFYEFSQNKFQTQGKIIKKEGYSSTFDMKSKDRVWLGLDRVIMVGDAAGLVDQVRGVGMDAAALSGRFVAEAILKAKKMGDNKPNLALQEYQKLMHQVTAQTIRNQSREITQIKSNAELMDSMKKRMLSTGVGMIAQNFLNKVRPVEKYVLLPP